MKTLKLFIFSLLLILAFSTGVKAEYLSDLIITSPNGIWTDSRTYSTLNAAITAVGANQRTIVIAKPQVVTNLTVPANVTLKFERDGSIANSGQLTIQTKSIIADDHRIFTGTGDIDLADGTVLRLSWFADLLTALTLTSDDKVTLIMNKAQTATATCAVGNDVTLRWESQNILTVNAGVVISNLGQIEAGNYQILAGAGNFRFRDGTSLNLKWFTHIRTALTWIDTNKVTLIVNESSPVAFSDSIPSNIQIRVNKGGDLAVAPGITLTLNSVKQIDIGPYYFDPFTGTGSVAITGGLTYTPATTLTGIILSQANAYILPKTIPYEVDALYDYGSGTSFTKATIDAAIADIGADVVTLLLRPGNWVVNSALAFPANVTLKMPAGAYFSGTAVTAGTITGLKYATPEMFGAISGSGDSTPFISAAEKSLVVGGTLFIPPGQWLVNTQLLLTRPINIKGDGGASVIFINVGAAATAIRLGGGAAIRGISWENFSIGGDTNSCAVGLFIANVHNSFFKKILVNIGTAGSGNAIQMDNVMRNYFNFTMSSNSGQPIPYTTGVWFNGIVVASNTGTAVVANANIFDCIIEGGTGKGLYIYATGDDGNNEIRGIYQGNLGHGIHLKECKGAHLHDVHLERGTSGGTTGNALVLESTNHVVVGANVGVFNAAGYGVNLVSAQNTVINGLNTNELSIDAGSLDTKIIELTQTGGIIDLGTRTVQVLNRHQVASSHAEYAGVFSDFRSMLVNGSAERWNATNAIPPGSWSFFGANPTWARESSIVKHGSYSAKVTLTNDPKIAGILLLDTIPTAQLPASAVATVSGWIYIPTTGGNNVSVAIWWDAGAETAVLGTITARDTWVKLSYSYLVRGTAADRTYSHILFSTASASAIAYLDGFSVVPTHTGAPMLFTPNADEFPVFTGTATWDPASIAASGYLAKDFTCPGAALGMVASAGAGIDVTDLIVSATVTAADVVTIVLFNPTVGAIDLTGSTWTVMARKLF